MLQTPGAMACALLFRLLLLTALPTSSQGNHLGPTSRLRYSTFLDPSNAEIITFELQVRTAGWVGLGITNRYTRVGSDLVVGGVSPDGNVYFSDEHLVDEDALEEDGSQDAELLALTENAIYTTMHFSRPFRSYATLKLDWECTFVKSIFLLQIVHPDDLDVPEDTIIHDLEITDFLIPEDDTTYACTFLPLPIISKKHHIYKFEPKLVHHKETMVHHIVGYACNKASALPKGISDCYGAHPAFSLCSQVIVCWAVGGTVMWVSLLGRLWTPSGSDWRFTTAISTAFLLRKYDMGVLQLGFFTFPIHFIPPGAESFASYGLCKKEQFEEMNGAPVPDIQVCGYLLHTHLAGLTLQAVQYRNGTQLRTICKDDSYDFNLQETRDLPSRVAIKLVGAWGEARLASGEGRDCTSPSVSYSEPLFRSAQGDELLVEGGPSTINEMCLIFLFYYPRNNISSCMGYADIIYMAHELGEEASDSMEGMMATNKVEWTPENIKKAEKACKEAQQTVIIKTIDVRASGKHNRLDSGNHPCSPGSLLGVLQRPPPGGQNQDRTPAGFRAAPMALSGSSTATPRRLPLTALLFGQGARVLAPSHPAGWSLIPSPHGPLP
ncbi:hypothetical protein E2I00_018882 [Balaenoptera physalus]|uniref:DOMON domain-containing protein n=1 Tax=Balaenoptera physalus TaxID=9770 RepID=A0A6A1Q8U8_BALPH|nr:hypothetical protein E2I00_018882 [Balaenoptera physalus]